MELQNLQDQLSEIQNERARVAQQGLDTSTLDATIRDLQQQIAGVENRQYLEERVEQAKETGYIADTLKANGIPLIELSHTPENYELTAIAFQKWALEQQDAFKRQVELLEEKIEELEAHNEKLFGENYTLAAEKSDAELKRDNAINQLEEQKTLNELQRDTIENLKAQLAGNIIPLAPLSAEEQETKLVADLMGNRLKVTDIRFKDESGLDRRKVLANNALTGEKIEEYAIYSKTRWEEISFEDAAQLQADYAIKKAEIEAQNTVIPTLESVIEPVTEVEAPAEEKPFPESEVHSSDNGEVQGDKGNESLHALVGQDESEVITLESLHERVKALEDRLSPTDKAIQQAVA